MDGPLEIPRVSPLLIWSMKKGHQVDGLKFANLVQKKKPAKKPKDAGRANRKFKNAQEHQINTKWLGRGAKTST